MIRLENVTKVYDGGVVAVKDVDLDINKGEFVFLVGPSGSGKSTLIRLMMREEAPTNGDIWIAGKHASELPGWKIPHLRRSIGTVFQDFKLLPNKTVYENVAFAMEVTGKSRSAIDGQVPQVLKLVGLSEMADRLPRRLSGGEQQRVSVARAFVNRPLILLADEPTGNLDPATSVGIMRILDRINRTGTTVVMATHDHAIVDAMRRRVVQLERGRLLRDESRGVYETAVVESVVVPDDVKVGDSSTEAGETATIVEGRDATTVQVEDTSAVAAPEDGAEPLTSTEPDDEADGVEVGATEDSEDDGAQPEPALDEADDASEDVEFAQTEVAIDGEEQ
jgi:cell division transport system ATP-binding protein